MSYSLVNCPLNGPVSSTTSPVCAKIVRVANGNLYAFILNTSDVDLYWSKSTDHGVSWSLPTVIKAGSIRFVDVWYDRWTDGNTGNLIHIAYLDAGNSDVEYNSLDTSTDTLSGAIQAFNGVSSNVNCWHSICRARGGNLYILLDIDGGTETGFVRSTAVGASASFSARSNTGGAEGADYFLLAPDYATDDQDIFCFFWDRSANEISYKLYDNSGDAWAETSISTGFNDVAPNSSACQFSLTIDQTNDKLILAAWNDFDLSTADLKCWSWVGSGTPALTARTDIVTNSDDCISVGLLTDGGTIYAVYLGKSDGSQTAGTSLGVYYKYSSDDGVTWSSEQTISGPYGAMQQVWASRTTANSDLPVITGRASNDEVLTVAVRSLIASGTLQVGPFTAGMNRT